MMYFDMEEKQWKQLSSLAPAAHAGSCYCAETVGGELFVATDSCIYCYDIETDKWRKHEDPTCRVVKSLCTVGDYMYAISSDYNQVTQRYNFPKLQWQSFAKLQAVITMVIFTVGQRPFLQKCMYFMDIRRGTRLVVTCKGQCFIVLTQRPMCGKKKLQPAKLTLDPVFL